MMKFDLCVAMNRRYIRVNFLPFLNLLLTMSATLGDSTDGYSNKCTSKESCGACIAEDPNCGWCTQEDYTQRDIPRCNFIKNLEGKCDNIENPSNSFMILEDMELSDEGTKEEEAIQIKPQQIRLSIRPNSPVTFNVEFRQAVDYPVDLYYLMDLSNSMKDDKLKLAELGDKLAVDMGTITTNFRLGFGSFVDKVLAPYTSVHPTRLRAPCENCAAPYGFQNNMPLSLETKEFANKVRESRVSGNLDAPEGGFDAIMQAVVCKEKIGWRNKSRKLLVLSTDNDFHMAGDGKLAGLVEPNDGNCHLNSRGYYTMSTVQDYPSLSQINHKIKENKVNIIFAVTKDKYRLYRQLSKRLLGSSTGKLEDDSSNVVQLVREQYNAITSSVEMNHHTRDSNGVHVTYQSSCLGNKKERTNICKGLKVGKNVTFEVTVEVSVCPKNQRDWHQTLEINPVGLNDHLLVHLDIMCECSCEESEKEERHSAKCNDGNGTYACGVCNCYENKYGKKCECDSLGSDPYSKDKECYRGGDSVACSNLGVCRCGKCDCVKRAQPDEKIYGKFCECENFSCDKKNGKICNGPDHGICDCGECRCLKGWTGKDCGCRESIENCIDYDGKICGEHGDCVCGACVCDNKEKEYFGKFCDDCVACPGKCEELRPCMECFVNENQSKHNCSICNVVIIPVETVEVDSKERGKPCTFTDDQQCRFNFKYIFDQNNQPIVHAQKKKECPTPVALTAIVSGAAGSVVGAGLLLLFLWKLFTSIHDRRELAKFEKERQKARWDAGENPIYKQATSTFQNPVYGGDRSSRVGKVA